MDSTTTGLDFAIIGHQDSWQTIHKFINGVRRIDQEELSIQKIKDIYSFIPPRDVFRINVKSRTGDQITGAFIETFIDPDKLEASFAKGNINKVMKAVAFAKHLGARIVTLGGFTSIVLEGNIHGLTGHETKFTTGNTLTAALIVKGVEKAANDNGLILRESSILIVGATGDIGSACVNYFKHAVKTVYLCARNNSRLETLKETLIREGVHAVSSTSYEEFTPLADIIIFVASSIKMQLSKCKDHTLICDAGYPKNIRENRTEVRNDHILFHGGMGVVKEGFSSSPDYSQHIYKYPAPYIIHGCLLEAMLLAFERRHENYSTGKGNITAEKIEEMYKLCEAHGIGLAPFYNSKGLWDNHDN